MPMTTAMSTTYKALQEMDKQINEAESHLRVLKAAQYPGTLALETNLAKAKQSRLDLMNAIQNEADKV